jgi:ABC-type glutathione transport system ATPase component
MPSPASWVLQCVPVASTLRPLRPAALPAGSVTGRAEQVRRRKKPGGGMATVDIRNVRKAFGSVEVLHGVSVDIADSEFVVLVGPSGCGKSTLLRMIAGLENISAGEIAIGKRVVNTLPPKDRDVAMVFQNYALYPHMTVFDNMAFSLKLANAPAPVMEREVQRAAQILGFSLRKSGDYGKASTFYRKALEFEPNHKGALEYLGELYAQRGELAKAREHVRLLSGLCPSGCEELDDLKAAIAQTEGAHKTN